MNFGQRLHKLIFPSGSYQRGPVVSICSREEFTVYIQREYNRSERTGEPFFVIEFQLGDPHAIPSMAEELLYVMARRLRTTDEVGWCGDNCIGALLIGAASKEAAANVAEDILAAMSSAIKPTYTIHSSSDAKSASTDGPDDPGGPAGGLTGDKDGAHTGGASKGTTGEASRSQEDREDGRECRTIAHRQKIQAMPITELKLMSKRAMPLWKRTMDVIISSVALVALSPLLLAVAVLIKIVSPGPVFFQQERVGYGGRLFSLYKFRTMHVNIDPEVHQKYVQQLINTSKSSAEGDEQPMIKLDSGKDPRIIPFGSFLRKTCIDELPQFINVLRKEMSVVGPRPPIPYEVSEYACWQTGRFDSFPGLTGLWQVSGKNSLSFRQMARLDIRYSRQMSFWLDCKIILLTPAVIISQIFEKEQHVSLTENRS